MSKRKSLDLIAKEFGKQAMSSASFLLEREKKIISVSPTIDIILSGGVPQGTIVMSAGKPKIGKSTMALSFAAQFQKALPNSCVFYFDIEGRLKEMNLRGITGLDLSEDKFQIISHVPPKDGKPARIYTAEEFLKMAKYVLENELECLLILDSASAMCTDAETKSDPSGQIRAQGPKLFAHFLKQNASAIQLNNSIFWSIHHLIANTSGYGEASYEDGGNKIQYWQDIRLRAKQSKEWKVGDSQIGLQVTWQCKNSALGSPNQSIESFMRFGHGLDREEDIIEMASSLDIINKSGSWYTYGDIKVQGKEKLNIWLKSNPAEQAKLEAEVCAVFKGTPDDE